jgi:exodeoxyribonuclease V alpha subunit
MMQILLESEQIAYADYFFAKTLYSKEEEGPAILLAYLLSMARGGHLCLRKKGGKIFPSPPTPSLEKVLLENFEGLPESICSKDQEASSPIYLKKNCLYLRKNYLLEKEFLFHLNRLNKGDFSLKSRDVKGKESLSDEQRLAVGRGVKSPLSLISGGPGTGKSFTAIETVRTFLAGLSEEDKKGVKIKLGAPTGKAASLLEKNIMDQIGSLEGIECGTLHSFLKKGLFPKSIFVDLFLVDEASMVDAELFVRLLTSLQSGGRVIFMGDKDQLPPVEAGGFFADLIEIAPSLSIPMTLLTKSLRVEEKALHFLSDAILSGSLQKVKKQPGVEVLPSFQYKEVKDQVIAACQDFYNIPIKEEFNPLVELKKLEEFTILNCMRKGPLGSQNLNSLVLESFLAKISSENRLAIPILIVANDPERGLMNGEVGLLVASFSSLKKGVYTSEDTAYFRGKEEGEGVYQMSGAMLPSFELGYCLSIHKSQGSEYSSVMILAPPGSERFGKEILYTAVTRAKKQARLLVEEGTLKTILAQVSRKVSGLVD